MGTHGDVWRAVLCNVGGPCGEVKRKFSWAARIVMLLSATALGGAMELVQAYLTTCRSGDWIDFEADAVGALIGLLVCVGLNWKLKKADA